MGIVPVGPVYHGLFTIPGMTLTSILSCRVYRRTRLEVMRSQSNPDFTLPTVNPLGPGGNITIPLSIVQFAAESNGEARSGEARSGDGLDCPVDTGETLAIPSKANTLSFSLETPHGIRTGFAP
jgi:hypothetical protein